ncbi:MAG: hypothetical protein DHS20C01_08040 [marine bacterium B5-7]|nr:MAG: hypothetical protein DHS20C01_08040 [marine bacterium B5-7]
MRVGNRTNRALYKENTRPRQLKGYLALSGLEGALERIANDVPRLRAQAAFDTLVPDDIRLNCDLILFRDGDLNIYTPHPVWASWLRNRRERLIHGFREARVEIRSIRVLVAPRPEVGIREAPEKPQKPTQSAAHSVHMGASTVSNPDLANALERLAKRLKICSGETSDQN